MKMNKYLLLLFGAALCACSVLSSCEKDEDDKRNNDLNDLAEQEEQVDEDSKKSANS